MKGQEAKQERKEEAREKDVRNREWKERETSKGISRGDMREMKKSEEGIKITQYMLNEEGERRLNNTKDKKGKKIRKK